MEKKYLTPAEVGLEFGRSRETIRLALKDGELHGSQRIARGKWTIRRDCAEAWIEGRPCEHQLAVAA